MRSVKMAAFVALLAGGMAFGASQIAYTLELTGNNHADLWENDETPAFTSGVTSGTPQVEEGQSITWAVRVLVSGTHEDPGGPGDQMTPLGAANLVFDLVLKQGGTPVAVQAAAITCSAGTPGNPGALICEPTGAGFWSSINDGDCDGVRGGGTDPDHFANGSFAMGLPGAKRVIDAIPGPNMDYGWYPSAGNRGGIPTSGGTPAGSTSAGDGELLGFGAGYKNYDFGTTYLPGVGMTGVLDPPFGDCGSGFGEDLPLFEGQISTEGLTTGVYTLELIPGANGNNIIHQGLNCFDMNYAGWGSFATQVNSAVATNSMSFEVIPGGAEIVASHVFYNASYYDGNSALLNASDNAAIDGSKALLVSGTSSFANYTGCTNGITGLMFDVANADPAPVQGDFAFDAMGYASTGPAVSKNASVSAFAVDAGGGVSGSDRVKFAFTAGSIVNTWLRITVGTGFGLDAPAVFWIGNQKGESNTPASGKALVNATDFTDTKNNPHGPFNRALVDDWYDVDKDSLVNATDLNKIRAGFSGPFNSIYTPITK